MALTYVPIFLKTCGHVIKCSLRFFFETNIEIYYRKEAWRVGTEAQHHQRNVWIIYTLSLRNSINCFLEFPECTDNDTWFSLWKTSPRVDPVLYFKIYRTLLPIFFLCRQLVHWNKLTNIAEMNLRYPWRQMNSDQVLMVSGTTQIVTLVAMMSLWYVCATAMFEAAVNAGIEENGHFDKSTYETRDETNFEITKRANKRKFISHLYCENSSMWRVWRD